MGCPSFLLIRYSLCTDHHGACEAAGTAFRARCDDDGGGGDGDDDDEKEGDEEAYCYSTTMLLRLGCQSDAGHRDVPPYAGSTK